MGRNLRHGLGFHFCGRSSYSSGRSGGCWRGARLRLLPWESSRWGVDNRWCQQRHYTGDFAYTNLESTSYWQVNLDGLKLNGAAVGSTPYAIVDSGTSLLAGPTTDVKSIAASLSLSTTILSSKEYTVDCSATYNVVYTVGGADYELT